MTLGKLDLFYVEAGAGSLVSADAIWHHSITILEFLGIPKD